MPEIEVLRTLVSEECNVDIEALEGLTEDELQELLDVSRELKKGQEDLARLQMKAQRPPVDPPGLTTEQHLEKLDGLYEQDGLFEFGSEEYREHENKILEHTNAIREGLGLEALPRLVRDSELTTVLKLDEYEIGRNCQDFIAARASDKATEKELERRLKDLQSQFQLEAASVQKEKEEKETILNLYQEVSGVIPPSHSEHLGRLVVNEKHQQWRTSLMELKRLLDVKIKSAQSLNSEDPEKYPLDRRRYYYRIRAEIEPLLESLSET